MNTAGLRKGFDNKRFSFKRLYSIRLLEREIIKTWAQSNVKYRSRIKQIESIISRLKKEAKETSVSFLAVSKVSVPHFSFLSVGLAYLNKNVKRGMMLEEARRNFASSMIDGFKQPLPPPPFLSATSKMSSKNLNDKADATVDCKAKVFRRLEVEIVKFFLSCQSSLLQKTGCVRRRVVENDKTNSIFFDDAGKPRKLGTNVDSFDRFMLWIFMTVYDDGDGRDESNNMVEWWNSIISTLSETLQVTSLPAIQQNAGETAVSAVATCAAAHLNDSSQDDVISELSASTSWSSDDGENHNAVKFTFEADATLHKILSDSKFSDRFAKHSDILRFLGMTLTENRLHDAA